MFSNFGFGEIAVLALLAMLVFGPEKLPRAAMDAARVIKKLRLLADGAVSDFKSELPADLADLDLRSMNPRQIVADALFDSGRPPTQPGQPGQPGQPDRPVGASTPGTRGEPGESTRF